MIRLLEAAAAAGSDRTAVVTTEADCTYADVLAAAERMAAGLVEERITRFAVVEPDAARLLPLLAGAAWAGAEPCQYQPDTSAQEFEAHAAQLEHDVVVTRRRDLGGAFRVVHPDSLLESRIAPPERSATSPLLVRTTGTTGVPKAARHDWMVLERTVSRVRPDPEAAWLLAYGPHQFAGLQVLQHVLAAQATLIAPFPRQPRDGLEALLHHRVTAVSATPTYWRFLLAEARGREIALPPLQQVTLGGEATSDSLLVELRRAFPRARISHVYASTEFGSVVSVADGRAGFAVDSLVSPTNPEANMKVVDGELWVRVQAGMLGYVGQDSSSHDEDFRPTGDLVEIVGDRVQFRGRSTEVINVGGVKVSPLPVEERIAALPGVAAVRAFGRPSALTGAIVAVEVVREPASSETELSARIRDAVVDLPPAWRPRSIRFVDVIETQGGKTVRRVVE